MADTKITALAAITTVDPANDVLPIVDVSNNSMAASGTTCRVTTNQLLGAGGTATLASATISGDLTVDTSTLKVDSANNRVGIKQASPSHPFQIGTTDLILDATGNVGIGVQPSAWASIYRTVELPNGSSVWGQTDIPQLNIQTNAFLNSSFAWIYKTTAAASNYRLYNGQHLWFTASSGTAGDPITTFGTAKMTLDASGRLLVGPTSANTSGGVLQLSSGITFPATQVDSSDANTLDDYEEGTFTPAITGSTTAGTATYVGRNGKYTKIGNQVHVQIFIDYNSHTGTGDTRITGLPFTNGANFSGAVVGYANAITITAGHYLAAYVDASQSFILLNQIPTGGGTNQTVPIDPAGTLVVSATYTV